MNGAKEPTTGAFPATNGVALSDESLRGIAEARERFATGADSVHGVRPEILVSWYRCREEYEVDPHLERAPAAAEGTPHSIEHDVVFTELGGLAAGAAREAGDDALVTVADCDGHVLATWGSRRVLSVAADSNLAPWSAWSERASGTNGMGTALETQQPLLVQGPEHWCQGFHSWMCAGVAVRDVVTHDPLAALNVSRLQTPLPDAVLPWLRAAAAATEATLRRRARHTGALLAAALADARETPGTPLAAVDRVGKVVLANTEAAVLLGTPADAPAYAPSDRWIPQVPALLQLTRRATARARQDPGWSGSTLLYVPFLDQPLPVAVRPVLDGSQVIGALLAFGSTEDPGFSEPLDDPAAGSSAPGASPDRVIALRDDRWVLLDPREIRYAETDHDNVWLVSDQGRLLAAVRGLDRLEQELTGRGFLRVHRGFLVNLGRVREIEHGFRGALFLATDTRSHETVPVARRQVPRVRQALGL
jgi:PAS domain-containing protein